MPEKHRDQIKRFAVEAFRTHALVIKGTGADGPYVWRCHRPGTSHYAFYVAELPGAIVQYGDVGGLLIEQGPAYDLKWLDGAIDSMDYVLGKSKARQDHFIEEYFKTYVQEHGKDPTDYECYDDYVMQTGDSEGYSSCHDYQSDALWAYWALHKFIELQRRAR